MVLPLTLVRRSKPRCRMRLRSARTHMYRRASVSETRLRGQCRGCGHGLAHGNFDVHALVVRGGSAQARWVRRVRISDSICTRVKHSYFTRMQISPKSQQHISHPASSLRCPSSHSVLREGGAHAASDGKLASPKPVGLPHQRWGRLGPEKCADIRVVERLRLKKRWGRWSAESMQKH